MPALKFMDVRLVSARRTALERQNAAKSGSKKGAQTVYNYARLGASVLDLFFAG